MLEQKTSRNQGKGGDTQSAKILLEYVREVRNELKNLFYKIYLYINYIFII